MGKHSRRRSSVDPPGHSDLEVIHLSEAEAEVEVEKENEEVLESSKKGGESPEKQDGFLQRRAIRMAQMPWVYLGVAMIASIGLSVIAFTVGGFDASVDNAGWQSRGTLIANRQTQLMMIESYQNYLFNGNSSSWDDLQNNVQPGWQSKSLNGAKRTDEDNDDIWDDRRLTQDRRLSTKFVEPGFDFTPKEGLRSSVKGKMSLPLHLKQRFLEEPPLEGCDFSWYFDEERLTRYEHLWPIWKSTDASTTILEPELMHQLCSAEEKTQKVLEENGLCFGCVEGCLPPFSPVLYARSIISGGFEMDCKQLSEEWKAYQADTESSWGQCVTDLKAVYDPNNYYEAPESCPVGFSALVEENFDETLFMTFTSSIFATESNVPEMYELVEEFGKGTDDLEGVYGTQYEGFNEIFTDTVVGRDMALACASAFITAAAILIHTRSPFLTGIGLMQIILSFPLSFFVYTFVGGLVFFPFLNFIGVFVVFALGADDIFVAVDKWKNARLDHPKATTEYVASIALPDAAGAMFLTTVTTAIAFFGTAICPVAPIKMFAIFCGLLIMFDYLMCCFLVFPALCIYDRKLVNKTSNCCIALCSKKRDSTDDQDEADLEKRSCINRFLTGYYSLLHRFRWILFAISIIGLAAAIYGATTLKLPTSAEVRLYGPEVEFEQNYVWRQNLLLEALKKTGGSDVTVGFGVTPADTGDLNSPEEWSQLLLDDSFDPSSEDSQKFLESFCPNLFAEDFASLPFDDYMCAFNTFASWLEDQSQSATPDDIYTENCGGATGIPVPQENFHSCIIEWSKQAKETSILSDDGRVRVIFFSFVGRVRWDSPFDTLKNEWNLIEDWMNAAAETAPDSVNKFFFSSMEFWWYDTNGQMLNTAYGAASIALAAAATVIFLSSRSFVLTLFATITIGYVLCSVTSTLVALGWTLGFLESICFAILIGVSVDFVIHFCHAYSAKSGSVDRGERTKDALIRMGPSILAAAVTTVAAAIIMLFTIIDFFQKFAVILFMTMIQASIGSFVVFLTFTDCIGPSNPTYLVDRAVDCVTGKKRVEETEQRVNKESPDEENGKVDTTNRTEKTVFSRLSSSMSISK